jgi:hypothetical protein
MDKLNKKLILSFLGGIAVKIIIDKYKKYLKNKKKNNSESNKSSEELSLQ